MQNSGRNRRPGSEAGRVIQCVTCARFDMRAAPAMAAQGFGACTVKTKGTYVSPTWPRECERHAPASDDVAQQRREWLAKRLAKFSNTSKTA